MPSFILPTGRAFSYNYQYSATGSNIKLHVVSSLAIDVLLVDKENSDALMKNPDGSFSFQVIKLSGITDTVNLISIASLPGTLLFGPQRNLKEWTIIFGNRNGESAAVFFEVKQKGSSE